MNATPPSPAPALHDLDPVFRQFSRSAAVCNVMRSLGYARPLPVQSMYIFKQPSIGGEVVPHQVCVCGGGGKRTRGARMCAEGKRYARAHVCVCVFVCMVGTGKERKCGG